MPYVTTVNKVRDIEVSMDNIKSWIETGLRQMGEVKDSEEIRLTFSIAADHTTVGDWEARKTIPLQIQPQHLEAKVTKF